MKILFFIGSLRSGGKERRLVELLSYLKEAGRYEMLLVVAYNEVMYPKFFNLEIKLVDLKKTPNSKSLLVFRQLYKICKTFRPDIIHTWGAMQTSYAIPVAKSLRIPIVNSQITGAPPHLSRSLFSRVERFLDFKYSDVICANSYAGLQAYRQENNKRSIVVYNGLDMNRFVNLADQSMIKAKYHIKTPYSVVMTASFSKNKNWEMFYQVADYVTNLRKDISFIGVGAVSDTSTFDRIAELSKDNSLILLPGRTSEAENLVNACDVGVLFSTNGEGISNSILEYMALGKPVIADEIGGTPEFMKEGYNGFFSTNRTFSQVGDLIIGIVENKGLKDCIGGNGKRTVNKLFTLERMGESFTHIYDSLVNVKTK